MVTVAERKRAKRRGTIRNASAQTPVKRSFVPADPGFTLASHGALIGLGLGTLLVKSLIYAPISWWPLTFVCLVPWLILIGASSHAPRVYLYSFLIGFAFHLINMRWMYAATGLGYVVLSAWQAVYFPLVALAVRHVVRRRRWPLAFVFPFVWTGSELLRAIVLSGFPWFFLSHSLYGVQTLIQISDVVGAYGVSFVAALVNGAVADGVFAYVAHRRGAAAADALRRTRRSWIAAVASLAMLIVYGQIQLHRDTTREGPKIAVIQGDFLSLVRGDPVSNAEKKRIYLAMMDAAAAEDPDLYLLPESPWAMYLNPEVRDFFPFARQSFAGLQGRATRDAAYVVTGSGSMIETPHDLAVKARTYNSATIFRPDGSEPGRYDKVHLVYFGEVVPFRFGRLRFLYRWLNRLMPFSGENGSDEYSLFPGDGFHRFEMSPRSQPGRSYHFGIPICYEDVMPYVSREFVAGEGEGKQVDFLLNISNDGWFGRGHQQPQHLAICVFRAVENRVGIARAVNTGVSAMIEPSGRVHDVVRGDPSTPWPGACGYSVARLGVDSRFTLYSRYGDWFAWLCAGVWLLFFGDYWVARVRAAAHEGDESAVASAG